MGCGDKIKHTCGTRINSRCVSYDGYIPEDSDLNGEDCITIEETTEDLYKTTDNITNSIDLSDLGDECIEYEEEEGIITVKEALKKHEEEICNLKNNITSGSGNTDCCIDVNTIDTSCLEDLCGTGFSTPNDLIQTLIRKICELESRIDNLQ